MGKKAKKFWKGLGPKGPIRVLKIIGMVIGGLALAALFALAFGWIVKLLWNALMPALFGLTEITYWQAVGLAILARLLIGGVGGGNKGGNNSDECDDWDWNEDDLPEDADWKDMKSFWKEEGKQHFEEYMSRKSRGITYIESENKNDTSES